MYDRAKAAHRRIVVAAGEAGEVGRMFIQLSAALMCTAESEQRNLALKRLADSCELAMAALAKSQQPRRNGPYSGGCSGKPSS